MTIHVPIKDAKNRLSALVRSAQGGERIAITRNGQHVADIVAPAPRKGGFDFEAFNRWKTQMGIDKLVTYVAPDFDDPLPDSVWCPEDED